MSLKRTWELVGGAWCGRCEHVFDDMDPEIRVSMAVQRSAALPLTPPPAAMVDSLEGVYKPETVGDVKNGILRWQGWQ